MKLTVSNIAWSAPLDAEAADLLQSMNLHAIEVAPTRLWPAWEGATLSAGEAFRQSLRHGQFSIPSLQAILFAKPAAKLFGTEAERASLVEHLRFCADLANALGATSLVFGAPKNRDRGSLSWDAAFQSARDLFVQVGPYYESRNVYLCLEANPPQYGCNFITDSKQAGELVRAVDSPGFRLHLDTACMLLAGEDIPAAIRANYDLVQHFHISEPNLGTFDAPVIDHAAVANCLHSLGYAHWLSLEMREAAEPMRALAEALRYVTATYGVGS
jgi:D-psicose/D-tagatose/L-ribulose 3-epimerase